jgi:hypothetical protein
MVKSRATLKDGRLWFVHNGFYFDVFHTDGKDNLAFTVYTPDEPFENEDAACVDIFIAHDLTVRSI